MLAVVLTACAFAPFALLNVDPHHDGIVLKPALDVLAGQVVFRDTFSQYGGGLPYLQAASLWAFGPTLAVLRLSAVAVYALAAGLLVGTWRLLLPRALVVLALLVWIALPGFYQAPFSFYAWSSVYALFFQALALFGLLRALFGFHPTAYGFSSGVACVAAFSCRQPVGAATGVAILVALGWALWASPGRRASRQALVGYGVGLTLSLGAGFALLWSAGCLDEWYQQTIAWPRRWASSVRALAWPLVMRSYLIPLTKSALPWWGVAVVALVPLRWLGGASSWPRRSIVWACYLLALLGALLFVTWYDKTRLPASQWIVFGSPITLVLFVAVSAVTTLVRGRTSSVGEIAAVGASCVAIASLHQYFPVPCPLHTWWALAPSVGVALYAAWRASGEHTMATALVAMLLVTPLVTSQARQAWRKVTAPYVRLDGLPVLEGMRVPAAQAAGWKALIGAVRLALHDHPNAPMLVEGRDALFAALVTNLRNPGPMYVEWDDLAVDRAAGRAAFVATERPLVFQQTTPTPVVQQAIAAEGYRRVFEGRMGSLLVPVGPGTPARQ